MVTIDPIQWGIFVVATCSFVVSFVSIRRTAHIEHGKDALAMEQRLDNLEKNMYLVQDHLQQLEGVPESLAAVQTDIKWIKDKLAAD